ncbi:hypothetical protein [Streptomyces fulvorobeus]|nr:hypothetical protein [Streptomyces fulvorobeus]NYE39851.1 hypothetical protein [Streptomyces fulvorobeus]
MRRRYLPALRRPLTPPRQHAVSAPVYVPASPVPVRPVPGFGRLRAVDPVTGRELPRGEVGLIQFSASGRCLT